MRARFALLAVLAFMAAPAAAAPDVIARYNACLDKSGVNPTDAFEDAIAWRGEGGGIYARHCAAVSLLEMDRPEEAAVRLEEAAEDRVGGGTRALRAHVMAHAGNAWMLAARPLDAERAFSKALAMMPDDADTLADRARARLELGQTAAARADLEQAASLRPDDAIVHVLRAEAALAASDLAGAERAVTRALALAPDNVDALLVRGKVREARRLAGG